MSKTIMLDIPATAEERFARSEMIAEVERLKDAVVDAAVEWHQSGREGDDTWFEKGEALSTAIDNLLARRAEPLSRTPTDKADLSGHCEVDDCGHCSTPQCCACYCHDNGGSDEDLDGRVGQEIADNWKG